MPVPDQVLDDGSGIQKPFKLLDSDFRQNDGTAQEMTFYESINPQLSILKQVRTDVTLAGAG
jgi:hypothetical protein